MSLSPPMEATTRRRSRTEKPFRVAAVDVGTNSIHTIIAEVRPDGTFQVVDRFKEMVRLGADQSDILGLSSRAMGEGVQALARVKQLCERHGVEEVCAAATSAVREAPNGAEFISLVRKTTGVDIRVITALEEARLIYLAASESYDFENRRGLILDIGGGSVEFIVGTQRDLVQAESLKVGVLRIRDAVPLSDPPLPRELVRMRKHIEGIISRTAERMRAAGPEFVLGTSGTLLAVMQLALAGANRNGAPLHHQAVTRAAIGDVVRKLSKMTLAERRDMDGLAAARADTILQGAMLIESVLALLRMDTIHGCTWALREGLLIDYLDRHRPELRAVAEFPDPRHRSVMALAERCHWQERHSRHVAMLAHSMFDQLAPLHGLGAQARELLEYGALLHDIGYMISASGHHKHSHYLIIHGGLLGFTPEEVKIIAAIARYNRKRFPSKNDPEVEGLSREQRNMVETLSAILRVADGLDRTHFSIISAIECTLTDRVLDLAVTANADAELELYHARRKADLLAHQCGREVRLRIVGAAGRSAGEA